MRRCWLLLGLILALALQVCSVGQARAAGDSPLGIFSASSDIGATQAGSTTYDPATKTYRMSGGGADIWGTADAFSFTWLRLSGDATLSADVSFVKPLAYPISKAVLMFRQSLDPGAPYADVAIHGDGHITLQYRATQGGETRDTTLPEHGTVRIRIQRNGDHLTAYAVSSNGQPGTPASIAIPLHDPVYLGLGVGAHNATALQTVTFSHVQLDRGSSQGNSN